MLLAPTKNLTRSIACLTLACFAILSGNILSAQNNDTAKSGDIKSAVSLPRFESLSKEKKESLRKTLMKVSFCCNVIYILQVHKFKNYHMCNFSL